MGLSVSFWLQLKIIRNNLTVLLFFSRSRPFGKINLVKISSLFIILKVIIKEIYKVKGEKEDK
jgi:uncharacterized protein with PQ loop repeat